MEVFPKFKVAPTMSYQDSDSDRILDQPITLAEVNYVVKANKNNKSTRSDGNIGELIKYGSNSM